MPDDDEGQSETAAEPSPVNKRPTRATPSDPTPWRDPKCDQLPGESRRAMQKRLGRKGGRPRKPMLERRFVPTQEQRSIVQLLAGYAIPHDEIAKAIRNPATKRSISTSTLARCFEHELEVGRAQVSTLLAAGLTKRLREANVTALIWVSKNLWNWSDRVEQSRIGHTHTDVSIKIAPEELSQKLKEFGLPSYVFGSDRPTPDPEPKLIEGNGHDSSSATQLDRPKLAQEPGPLDDDGGGGEGS
jgi:hypothetical protein